MGLFKSLHKRLKKIGSAPLRAGAKLAGKLPGGKQLNRMAGKVPGANRIIGGSLEPKGKSKGRPMAGRPGVGAGRGIAGGFGGGAVGAAMAAGRKKRGY